MANKIVIEIDPELKANFEIALALDGQKTKKEMIETFIKDYVGRINKVKGRK